MRGLLTALYIYFWINVKSFSKSLCNQMLRVKMLLVELSDKSYFSQLVIFITNFPQLFSVLERITTIVFQGVWSLLIDSLVLSSQRSACFSQRIVKPYQCLNFMQFFDIREFRSVITVFVKNHVTYLRVSANLNLSMLRWLPIVEQRVHAFRTCRFEKKLSQKRLMLDWILIEQQYKWRGQFQVD